MFYRGNNSLNIIQAYTTLVIAVQDSTLLQKLGSLPGKFFNTMLDKPEFFVSTISLLIVLWIFYINRKDRKEEQKYKVHLFWFQDIIIKNNYKFLLEFFYNTNSLLHKYIGEVNLRDKKNIKNKTLSFFHDFKTNKRELLTDFINLISIINDELYSTVSNLFNDFEDEILIKIDQYRRSVISGKDNGLDSSEITKILNKHSQKFFLQLYNYNLTEKVS